jgi:hypothetical protein
MDKFLCTLVQMTSPVTKSGLNSSLLSCRSLGRHGRWPNPSRRHHPKPISSPYQRRSRLPAQPKGPTRIAAVGPSSTPHMAVAQARVGSRCDEAAFCGRIWQGWPFLNGHADGCAWYALPPPHPLPLGAQIHGACGFLVGCRQWIYAVVVVVVVSHAALGTPPPNRRCARPVCGRCRRCRQRKNGCP